MEVSVMVRAATIHQTQKTDLPLPAQKIIQRKAACGKSPSLSVEASNGQELSKLTHAPGKPLDSTGRIFMESLFQHDFSSVRVHDDAGAAESAKTLEAFAYTAGNDIVFDTGRYSPGSTEGQALLAHELTHVVQQQTGRVPLRGNSTVVSDSPVHEREAAQMAATATLINRSERSGRTQDTASRTHSASGTAKNPPVIQASKKGAGIGAAIGAGIGLVAGALLGGLAGGVPGAIIGGLVGGAVGAGVGALIGLLFKGKKITVDNSCKGFCKGGLNVKKEAEKADAKTTDNCKNVSFNYRVNGEKGTKKFAKKINFGNVTVKCNPKNPNCGGWSKKGLIVLGKSACKPGPCGPLASTILHEMVHDWAGWGPPYDKKNVTVPGASHTSSDYLDEWVARYVEKSCFKTNPWGLP